MTLTERNNFFKVGIVFCAVFTLIILAASFLLVPSYSTIDEEIRRPGGIIQPILGRLLSPSFLAVHISMGLTVLFSLVGICLIHSFFEQTSAPEIPFIAAFIISFSFEAIRLALPMYQLYVLPSFYIRIALRILLFARFFGIFSLLAASVCAAGLEIQQTRSIVLMILAATMTITVGIPIDTQNWDTSFNVIYGFNAMLRLIEFAVVITTVLSFFVAVKNRETKEYGSIGIGILFALIGRYFLLYFDNWAGPVPGCIKYTYGCRVYMNCKLSQDDLILWVFPAFFIKKLFKLLKNR